MALFKPDFILRIQHPILNEDQPGNESILDLVEPFNQSKWRVTLSRAYDFLKVSVNWGADSNLTVTGSYIHVLPLNGSKPMMFDFSTQTVRLRGYASFFHVHTEAVQYGQNHGFYLIQSIAKELPPSFYILTINKPPSLPAYERNETTTTMEAQISVHADFPQDKWFYIKSKASGLVLDVDHGFGRDHTMLGANIGLNHQKLYCSSACHPLLERQLWRFESGFLINHCTGLVLDVDGLQYKTNTRIMQWSRSNPETNTNQQWDVSHGLIHVKGKPNLVLGVDGNAACDDTSIRIGERKNNDLNQLWSFEAVTFPSLTSQTGDSHTAKTDKRISNEYESSPLARVLDVEHSPQNRQLKEAMSVFLRDIYSVDTQFVFKSADKTTSNTRLWAHRSILAKYTVFDDLLKQAALASIGSNVAPLSVSVAKVTFAAFAALLKFLYIGEVERSNYPNHFAISEAGWNSQVNNGGLKDRHRWHPLDLVTPLSDEPITWQELLDAATIYKLDALRARCETALKLITKVSVTSSTDVRPTLSTYTKEELFD